MELGSRNMEPWIPGHNGNLAMRSPDCYEPDGMLPIPKDLQS